MPLGRWAWRPATTRPCCSARMPSLNRTSTFACCPSRAGIRARRTTTTSWGRQSSLPRLPTARAPSTCTRRRTTTRYGVHEYLVVTLGEGRLRWFDLRAGRELEASADGVVRLQVTPGLWVDTTTLFAGDHAGAMATLERGLATPEHAEFVRRLSPR